MKTLFNYCFYRIAKAYKILTPTDYCDWGYGVIFATLGLYSLTIVTWVLHFFQHNLNNTIIICVLMPFIVLNFASMFLNHKDKYIKLENRYKNEKHRKIKGWLVAIYAFGSLVLYIIAVFTCR